MPTRFNLLDEVKLVKSPAASSSLPARRQSFLARRSSSRATKNAKSITSVTRIIDLPGPRIPMEILEAVVASYADGVLNTLRLGQETLQRAFSKYIKDLVLASRDLRFLSLKYLCETLRFVTAKEARFFFEYLKNVTGSSTDRWSGGLTWVKSLSTPAFLIPGTLDIVKCFTNIRNLHIDASHSTLFSQQSTLSRLFGALKSGKYPVVNIVSFTVTNLPRIDHQLLELIANGLPAIEDLYLSTLEGLELTCCGPCYEESLSRVNHSPLQAADPDGENLAVNFGKALSNFKSLRRVHLGIFLSRYDVIEQHSSHNPGSQHFASTFESIADCEDCAKYEKETKRRELNVSMYIARSANTLKIISWASGFVMANPSSDKLPEDSFIELGTLPCHDHPTWVDVDTQPKSAAQNNLSDNPVFRRFQDNNIPWRSKLPAVARFHIDRSHPKFRLTRML